MPPQNPRLPKLSDVESEMYSVIKSRKGSGIWTNDLKKEVMGPPTAVAKALKSLLTKNLIKEVISIKNKSRKMVMAVEFEPSADVSGGAWYQSGSLDVAFIKILRQQCRRHVEEHKVATCEMVRKAIKEPKRGRPPVFTTEITLQQVYEILELMVLDKEVEKVRSSGVGDFSHVPEGRDCYRVSRGEGGPKEGAFASIPCGVCPRIHECTPDGVISPINCVYYNKWLGGLDF
ncbi:uncharacterized protein A4U43_C09F13600 [Asparagus officinalis]|uniref:DNA-directed RNA polymerase III subunit RPC6 n=1 Tax=Asparagus officinalis TaxID=4686 RepID=A0A5P1E753_ASPOF|nr:DNA-directed RNA polymerase III subunit RPC6 [Asparagus officinalis]XP_020246713.1 DNA-directed RNA polymerase III subunit RPC6 [Asparagus officinalis]ONK58492.1 uncharacterized protein A4U43_C09F13600 [Asparagus officinalis]